ncbi:class I SAM-dependent methyltransferase [Kitasatospora sp. A2-31]|uniref:class I SAM-dependent methyltransferase n=1 Tax=Kitasatospora sp. A2-31 TaxID=2916414 RepID=UPI001EEA738E|nr:class I SAM-dependent methyltransferase [Kitasatospora sp. A2-31]MCG6495559.1 class I SAM-dependent methyltransferase [Kitasatospora sp. A2-31]
MSTGLLPDVRTPTRHRLADEADRLAYDRYVAARNQYKEEFLDLLEAACADGGPVLEVGPGYGGFASLLLARRPVDLRVLCTDPNAVAPLRERLGEAVPVGHWRPGDPLPDGLAGGFALAYSVHALGECTEPADLLRDFAGALAPGGRLLVNDLRRDPDPFILEYTLREMAADDSPDGQYRLRTYLDSLRGAWTCAELRARLDAAEMADWVVDPDGPMALTVEHHRAP